MDVVYPIQLKTETERAELLDALVYAYARQPAIRLEAKRILAAAGVTTPDPTETAAAVFQYVQDGFPYILEAGEQFETPAHSIRHFDLGGDCDAHALLVATLLESVGVPVKLAYWRGPGRKYAEHVSATFYDGEKWVNLDTTNKHPMGWAPSTWGYKLGDRTERAGFDLATGADTTPPERLPGMQPLGVIGYLVRGAKALYRGAKKVVGAALELGADALGAVADLLDEIPVIGEALAAITNAVIATAAAFVEGFTKTLEAIGGVVETVLRAAANKLEQWASDWRTWARMALTMLACAGGAALAGAATGGAGAVAVVSACASSWASAELTALSLDAGTESFEDLTGIDIPDYLEPANLKRLVDSAGTDWSALGDVALDDMIDAAEVYALAEIEKQIDSLPGRIGQEMVNVAMSKLEDVPGFDQLPAAAKQAIRNQLSGRGVELDNLGEQASRAAAQVAARARAKIPEWDELAPDLQAELTEKMNEARARIPGMEDVAAELEQQIADLATAQSQATAALMEELAPGQGFAAAAGIIADLDLRIDVSFVKPNAEEVFRAAGLDELLPLTPTEIQIYRRAGGWVGDTGAGVITSGRYTPDSLRLKGGEITDPVSGAKAVIKYRARGIDPGDPMLKALQTSGISYPILTTNWKMHYLIEKPPKEQSVVLPMVTAAAAAAVVAAWKV